MSIDIDHFQDSGPLSAGRGTTTIQIDNIGLKSNGGVENLDYAEYPLIAPSGDPFARSFKYFTFFKLSGTYVKASRVRIKIEPLSGVKTFYRLTDTYSAPDAVHTGDLIYVPSTQVVYPRLSTTGPNTGLIYPQYLTANTTYYTEYLELQVYVPVGTSYQSSVGKITCWVDEYEEDDL